MIDAATTMLVPPGTTPGAALALLCLSFFTSALTGALGLGGGVMMLAAMTQLLPPAVLLPVHGVVQIGRASCRERVSIRV